MAYESITLKQEIIIDQIITIHYFEYMSDFVFTGESHDFWEFLCVDKGTVNVIAGDHPLTLNKGDVIFHKPNEFHNVSANGLIAPNLVVISFKSDSPAIRFFENKILQINAEQKNLLGLLIKEAKNTYSCRLDDPYSQKLIRKSPDKIPFGSEQLIKMYLQQFLINLVRNSSHTKVSHALPKSITQNEEEHIFNRIVSYMEANLDTQLTIDRICQDTLIGRSILQKTFRDHCGCGAIDYFSAMKITAAKQMIRDGHMNFTQIADSLGYSSIHYFSRQFKKIAEMTPSEYASSIKLLAEDHR